MIQETQFVKNYLIEPGSYTIDTLNNNDGQITTYEYKVEKSPAIKKLELLKNGKIEIPRWIVYALSLVFIGLIAFFIAAVAIFASTKPDAIYGESCKTTSCSKALKLKCINGVCQCESPKYYKGYCADLSKYDESCMLNSHCDPEQGLTCVYSKCGCASNFFWSRFESKCIERRSYGEDCSGDECKININLSCNLNSGTCECIDSTKYYWNGTACVLKKSYSYSCSSDTECLTDYEMTYCDGSVCNCTTKQYFDPSISQCLSKVGENMTCQFNDMCLSPMFCSSSKFCTCSITQFYDPYNFVCTDKYLNGEFCNSDHECRNDLGLKCQGETCSCQAPNYVWYSIGLECKLSYSYSSCSSDSDCNPSQNLVCTSNCTCPAASGNGICDCKRIKDSEFYWDGSNCVPALSYGSPCTNNYECQTLTQDSFCNTTTGLCDCATPGGYSSIDKVCKKCFSDEVYFNETCYYFSSSSNNNNGDAKNRCDVS